MISKTPRQVEARDIEDITRLLDRIIGHSFMMKGIGFTENQMTSDWIEELNRLTIDVGEIVNITSSLKPQTLADIKVK